MPLVRRGKQWPLLPYFDRVRRRFGGVRLLRNRPVSPFSPKPLATAIVSPPAPLPRPLRYLTGERSPLRNWSALLASPHPPPALMQSVGPNIIFCRSNQS